MNEQFGPYRLIEKIANGGMAEIFKAKTFGQAGFEKILAIKRLHPRYTQYPEFVKMIKDEAKLAVGLNHSNIVQVFDLGKVQDHYYIAMEYIHGYDLNRCLNRLKSDQLAFPYEAITYMMIQACSALDYAHRKKDDQGNLLHLIHRDVSPHNILVSFDGDVKIIDFGIAKSMLNQEDDKEISGKFCYMSPEQASGKLLDHRTDIFSLGIVFYELLTNQMLYSAQDDMVLLNQVRNAEFIPAKQFRPDIPKALEHILNKALSKNRDERYPSARHMQHSLEKAMQKLGYSYGKEQLGELMVQIFPTEQSIAEDSEQYLQSIDDFDEDELSLISDYQPNIEDRDWDVPEYDQIEFIDDVEIIEDDDYDPTNDHIHEAPRALTPIVIEAKKKNAQLSKSLSQPPQSSVHPYSTIPVNTTPAQATAPAQPYVQSANPNQPQAPIPQAIPHVPQGSLNQQAQPPQSLPNHQTPNPSLPLVQNQTFYPPIQSIQNGQPLINPTSQNLIPQAQAFHQPIQSIQNGQPLHPQSINQQGYAPASQNIQPPYTPMISQPIYGNLINPQANPQGYQANDAYAPHQGVHPSYNQTGYSLNQQQAAKSQMMPYPNSQQSQIANRFNQKEIDFSKDDSTMLIDEEKPVTPTKKKESYQPKKKQESQNSQQKLSKWLQQNPIMIYGVLGMLAAFLLIYTITSKPSSKRTTIVSLPNLNQPQNIGNPPSFSPQSNQFSNPINPINSINPINPNFPSPNLQDSSSGLTPPQPTEMINLQIQTDPPGADISINQEWIKDQKTPIYYPTVEGQLLQVEFYLRGYESYKTTFIPQKVTNEILNAKLVPEVGKLKISSNPSGAEIFLISGSEQKMVAYTPKDFEAPKQRLKIEIRKQGYASSSHDVLWQNGNDEIINVTLQKLPEAQSTEEVQPKPQPKPKSQPQPKPVIAKAKLSVQSRRWGSIFVDGRQVAQETPLVNFSVNSGEHRVKICFMGNESNCVERVIFFQPNENKMLRF